MVHFPPSDVRSPMRKPSLLVIFLTVFIDLIGFGIVLPLLPIYSREFGASGFTIGAIMAAFSAMQFLFVWHYRPWVGSGFAVRRKFSSGESDFARKLAADV